MIIITITTEIDPVHTFEAFFEISYTRPLGPILNKPDGRSHVFLDVINRLCLRSIRDEAPLDQLK